jgi:hypothetical protein
MAMNYIINSSLNRVFMAWKISVTIMLYRNTIMKLLEGMFMSFVSRWQ